jgi:hypothetical protein
MLPRTRNGGAGEPQTGSQSAPEGPQATTGLESGVWDGPRLNSGIGGYRAWVSFTSRSGTAAGVRLLHDRIGIQPHVYEFDSGEG